LARHRYRHLHRAVNRFGQDERGRRPPLVFFLVLLLGAAVLGGCGGGSTDSSSAVPSSSGASAGNRQPDAAWSRRAEAICHRTSAETLTLHEKLAAALARSGNQQEAINDGLVKPGVALLESESRQMRELRPPPGSPSAERFVGLFEPVLVLAHARVAAGEDLNLQGSHELEQLIVGLTAEQSGFARESGLKACQTGFFEALGGVQ
jgi:hypothetical protein